MLVIEALEGGRSGVLNALRLPLATYYGFTVSGLHISRLAVREGRVAPVPVVACTLEAHPVKYSSHVHVQEQRQSTSRNVHVRSDVPHPHNVVRLRRRPFRVSTMLTSPSTSLKSSTSH
jgi:hypothetical protein